MSFMWSYVLTNWLCIRFHFNITLQVKVSQKKYSFKSLWITTIKNLALLHKDTPYSQVTSNNSPSTDTWSSRDRDTWSSTVTANITGLFTNQLCIWIYTFTLRKDCIDMSIKLKFVSSHVDITFQLS